MMKKAPRLLEGIINASDTTPQNHRSHHEGNNQQRLKTELPMILNGEVVPKRHDTGAKGDFM